MLVLDHELGGGAANLIPASLHCALTTSGAGLCEEGGSITAGSKFSASSLPFALQFRVGRCKCSRRSCASARAI